MHEYAFWVRSVHDGDTIRGDLDLGFNLGLHDVSLRIHGIDAPELTVMVNGKRKINPAGEPATLHLLELLGRHNFEPTRLPGHFGIPGDYLVRPGVNVDLVVHTRILAGEDDSEKYGRVLASSRTDDGLDIDLGAAMLQDGFAVPKVY